MLFNVLGNFVADHAARSVYLSHNLRLSAACKDRLHWFLLCQSACDSTRLRQHNKEVHVVVDSYLSSSGAQHVDGAAFGSLLFGDVTQLLVGELVVVDGLSLCNRLRQQNRSITRMLSLRCLVRKNKHVCALHD